jgi:hypothetical protein
MAGIEMNWTTEPPTQAGAYWFQPETTSRALMVDVRMTNGALTVWWPTDDQPVGKLKGRWRGPIPPSSGPGSRQIIAE